MLIHQILFIIATYLVCSIPFGLILVKVFRKKDIRKYGSGNIGATNVTRVCGKKLGFLTFICDALKGGLMVFLGKILFSHCLWLTEFLLITSLVAIIGHIFSIYLNFSGGKGVATTLAVFVALDYTIGCSVLLIWVIVFAIFRISSISSITAIFFAIVLSLISRSNSSEVVFYCLIFTIILFKHTENVILLIKGKERKLF